MRWDRRVVDETVDHVRGDDVVGGGLARTNEVTITELCWWRKRCAAEGPPPGRTGLVDGLRDDQLVGLDL